MGASGRPEPRDVPASVDLIKNSERLIRLRWLVGLAVLSVTPISVRMLGVHLPARALYILGGVILAYNGLLWWALRRAGMHRPRLIAAGQVVFDWLALTAFVHLTGGVESPALSFFLFHVLLVSGLLPGRTAYLSAGLVTVVVAAVAGLEAWGMLPHYCVLQCVLPALPPDLYRHPLYIAGVLGFFATTVTVTAGLMVPIMRELRERERQVTTLYQSIQALSSSLDLQHVLDHLARGTTHALQAKAASIRLLDTSDRLELRAAYGLSKRYLEKGPVEVEHSLIDQEALSGQPVIVENTAHDECLQYPDEIVAEGIRSMLCVALIGRRGPLGVLHVYGRQPDFFGEEDADFVTAIARQGAIAIENALAYRESQRTDEMKSQFVRAVTHELRSPVSGAQSLLRTVMRDLAGGLNDLQRDVLRRLSDRLDALQMLIDDLLDLAAGKVEGLETELAPVSVEMAILNVVEKLSSQAGEKGIDLRVNYVPRALTVVASEEGLERIFLNLIGNAVKYTPAGGQVSVDLRQRGEEAIITVADTGIGIPEKDLPHLFEEFYRASNAKRSGITGTGLGLAIVKSLAERYKGRVSVQSKVGEGTTFIVALPLAGAPSGRPDDTLQTAEKA
jgi:signal transduction histidine kinase